MGGRSGGSGGRGNGAGAGGARGGSVDKWPADRDMFKAMDMEKTKAGRETLKKEGEIKGRIIDRELNKSSLSETERDKLIIAKAAFKGELYEMPNGGLLGGKTYEIKDSIKRQLNVRWNAEEKKWQFKDKRYGGSNFYEIQREVANKFKNK